MNKEYVQGFHDALEEMDMYLTNSIKRNGGGQTALQVVNVFNDLIAHLHQSKSYMKSIRTDMDEMEKEDEVVPEVKMESDAFEAMLQSIFPNATLTIIKGGN